MTPALRRPAIALAAVALAVLPFTATASELEDARERAADLEDSLATATERYEETWAAVELATAELEALERRAAALEREAAQVEARLADRARQVFKHGSGSTIETLLASGGPEVAIERAGMYAIVHERETAGLEEAVAIRTALDQTRALTEDRRASLAALKAEFAEMQETLEAELARAEQEVVGLEQRAARQRRVDRGSQQGTYACPLDTHLTHFIDSWGFPRSGGRRHQGTDIMGPMGAPVYAFTSGVIARHTNSRLGGISLYLRGDDGNTYFYTHLQGYAPRGAVGTRVQAGDHIAFNGNTGNARGGAPHVHFERHPGGGRPVNPYPWLAAACY